MRNKIEKSCGRDVDYGEDLGRGRKTNQESTGSVAANQDSLENSKEAGREAQGTRGLSKNCRCIGSVSSLSRVIKYFQNKNI